MDTDASTTRRLQAIMTVSEMRPRNNIEVSVGHAVLCPENACRFIFCDSIAVCIAVNAASCKRKRKSWQLMRQSQCIYPRGKTSYHAILA
jgi:hypothetical protein